MGKSEELVEKLNWLKKDAANTVTAMAASMLYTMHVNELTREEREGYIKLLEMARELQLVNISEIETIFNILNDINMTCNTLIHYAVNTTDYEPMAIKLSILSGYIKAIRNRSRELQEKLKIQ